MDATRRSPVRRLAAVLGVCAIVLLPAAARSSPPDADSLLRRAHAHLARNTPEERQAALRDLEVARREARNDVRVLHAMAWTYAAMGHSQPARQCLDRIARMTPDDGPAQYRLGQLWKWEWLASLDRSTYRKSLECLLRSAALEPTNLEARLGIAALALSRHNIELATRAAQSALVCAPRAAETALTLACVSYRAGNLTRADSAFRVAMPGLPADLLRRFTDLRGIAFDAPSTPLASDEADQVAVSFWRERDPDLTTPENEARLDFLARVAHAVLLFRDDDGIRWDMRAELLVRYGIPARVEPPPLPHPDQSLTEWQAFTPLLSTGSPPFPYHSQTWVYPELGLRVEVWDRSLRQEYVQPVTYWRDADPRPRPEWFEARPDVVVMDEGRGVYRAFAPGVTLVPARGGIAQFPSDSGARLVAHVETQGEPSDSLWGAWAVVDTDGRALARWGAALSVSACDPGGKRVAQFDVEVPPGDYRVHLTVDDRRGRRGLVRLESHVAPPSDQLAVSELVVLCGTTPGHAPGRPVLLEPDFDRRMGRAGTVSVYFEIDRLSLDADGRGHFAYHYALRRADGDARRRAEPAYQASREEENVGARRRQFVSVPLPALEPGSYDLEIVVHDLRSNGTATRSIRLRKT